MKFLNDTTMERTTSLKAVDNYSAKIKQLSEGMWEYEKDSSSGCLISEASLKEILFYLSNCTFGMVSPVLIEEPISHNVERLASFRASIQSAGIPIYHSVTKLNGENSGTDIIQKGYILLKPDHMGKERFFQILLEGIKDCGQDAFVIKSPDEDLLCVDQEGHIIRTYAGDLSIDLLAKASSYRLPMNSRFSFIGLEIPNGSIMSFQLFKGSKVEYYLPEDFFERKKVK